MAGLISQLIKKAPLDDLITGARPRQIGLDPLEGSFRRIDDIPLIDPPLRGRPSVAPLPSGREAFTPAHLFTGGVGVGLVGGGLAGRGGEGGPLEGEVLPPGTLEERFESGDFTAVYAEQKQQIADQQGLDVEAVERNFEDTVKQGVSEEDRSLFDKVLGEMDLLTIGLHLLASNDGERNLGQNLGRAMLAGIKSKQGAKASAKKGELEERGVAAKEKTAQAALISAIGKVNKELQIGTDPAPSPTKTELAITQGVLSNALDVKLNNEKDGHSRLISDTTKVLKSERQRRKNEKIPPMSPAEENELMLQYVGRINNLVDEGIFSDKINPDALRDQGQVDPVLQRILELQQKAGR